MKNSLVLLVLTLLGLLSRSFATNVPPNVTADPLGDACIVDETIMSIGQVFANAVTKPAVSGNYTVVCNPTASIQIQTTPAPSMEARGLCLAYKRTMEEHTNGEFSESWELLP